MHPMTRIVSGLVPQLEFAQFQFPDERDRIWRIHELALSQVNDDLEKSPRDRVGRQHVNPRETIENESSVLYPARTPNQLALEEGLQPLLDSALTGEQRVLVRWRYAARYTEREIAGLLGISQPAVHYRFNTIHDRLRTALLSAFGPKEVSDDSSSD